MFLAFQIAIYYIQIDNRFILQFLKFTHLSKEHILKLFSFTQDDESGIGVQTDKDFYNLSRALEIYNKAQGIRQPISFTFLQVFVEMGYSSGSMINNVLSDPWVQSKFGELRLKEGFRYNLPIARPSKIIGMGRNYKAHAKELDHKIPEEPIFFCKAPSSLLPHDSNIIIPYWLDSRVDHEAELGLIIGKEARNISIEDALSFVAGYTIINDVTARSIQKKDLDEKKPWFRSKSLDTFCPMGPFLVPSDQISDPHALEIRLTVNGHVKQKSTTSSMIFSIPEIVSYLSGFMTLQPGDIIATGTPHGVSPIKDGDCIETTITGLGTLRNVVVKEKLEEKQN